MRPQNPFDNDDAREDEIFGADAGNGSGDAGSGSGATGDDLRLPSITGDYHTMQDLVFTTLRDEIFAGRLKPGDRLNTSELARRLGVSRMPVREALNRLISVGLVENLPHRGAFVTKLSVEEVIEIYYIRAALEGIAARLAVQSMTPQAKKRLLEICDAIERAINEEDDLMILRLNFDFHSLIYESIQSERIEDLIFQYYTLTEQYRALGLDLPGRYDEIKGEHRRIAEAIAAGDADAAEKYGREHHLTTARRIARSVGSTRNI